MKSLLAFVPLFIFILPTTSIFILLPLYLYPGTSASAWNNIFTAIAANSNVQWEVIVNPNSGPGTTGYPDDNYITAIAKLNSYDNVHTIGYIDTKYTDRAYSEVTAEIDTYASWAGYANANIAIHGVFFDDVNSTADGTVYTYMNNAASYARGKMSSAHIVFNPGTPAPAQLFNYADTVVEFENPYSNYQDDATIATIPSQYRDQSGIIVNTTPESADVKSLVQTMAAEGIEAVYFSGDCCYNVFDSTLLTELAEGVQAG